MSEVKFKVGDRVKIKDIELPAYSVIFKVSSKTHGFVRDVQSSANILVEFDDDVRGHNGATSGTTYKQGHCLWIMENDLELVNDTVKEHKEESQTPPPILEYFSPFKRYKFSKEQLMVAAKLHPRKDFTNYVESRLSVWDDIDGKEVEVISTQQGLIDGSPIHPSWCIEIVDETTEPNEETFKVGDRVRVTNKHYEKSYHNKVGTVVCVEDDGFDIMIGVKFYEILKGGHSCDGRCEFGYGRYFIPSYLEKIEEETVEKEPKSYNGRVICLDAHGLDNLYTKGKIYEIKNGRLYHNKWKQTPMLTFESFEDLQKNSIAEWLEITGEQELPIAYHGKIVCISDDNRYFKLGKIYQVINGVLIDEDLCIIGDKSFKTLEEINNFFRNCKFMEVFE